MVPWKVLKYGALAVGLFVLVSAVVSVVWTILGIVASVLAALLTLLVVGGIACGLVKGLRWLRGTGGDAAGSRHAGSPAGDQVDGLTERYVDGPLSEAQLERELERKLDGRRTDEIDRELERVRSK